MATPLIGHGRNFKHLTCGVCREVFRSPRLLPCHHSFCQHCLDGLIRSVERRGQEFFPCPQCRRRTEIPTEGAEGFQMNFHIPQEDLELARTETVCPIHEMECLVFFCQRCEQPICIRCKLTRHENHQTEDMSETAARCKDRLETCKNNLDDAISFLTNKSKEAEENVQHAKRKKASVKEMLQMHRDHLISRVETWMNRVQEKIDELSRKGETQQTEVSQKLKLDLGFLVGLRDRVQDALEGSSDAEKVLVDKEVCQGKGSEEHLEMIKGRVPADTVRPGLQCDQSVIPDGDIQKYLGFPVLMSMRSGPLSGEIRPVYRCGQDGACREVHAVCCTSTDVHIAYGGTAPSYEKEKRVTIDFFGKKLKTEKQCKGRVSFQKSYLGGVHSSYYNRSEQLMSKGCHDHERASFRLYTSGSAGLCQISTVSISTEPGKLKVNDLFVVHCGKPTAFDVSKDGQLFAVVEEKKSKETQKTVRMVHLIHREQRRPFSTYSPPDTANFLPADICFWSGDSGGEKLLVTDPQNDRIHIVRIEGNICHFERYLAEGNGHLVCPTALDTDTNDNVYIGCGTGRILKYVIADDGDSECDNESDAASDSMEESDTSIPLAASN